MDFVVNTRNSRISSLAPMAAARFGGDAEVHEFCAVTLDDQLDAAGVEEIDLPSMEIELLEPEAFADFGIERFRPEFVVIELPAGVRDELEADSARHLYAKIE